MCLTNVTGTLKFYYKRVIKMIETDLFRTICIVKIGPALVSQFVNFGQQSQVPGDGFNYLHL